MNRKKKRRSTRTPESENVNTAPAQVVLVRFFVALIAIIVLMIVFVYCLRWMHERGRQRPQRPAATGDSAPRDSKAMEAQRDADASPADDEQAASIDVSAVDSIRGSWRRTDAGYVIAINEIHEDGRLDASYYNPNPIHVSEANVTLEDDVAKLFIELRDVGYPGSTYRLEYDADNDQLTGSYFAAGSGETFSVDFTRER